MNFQKVVDAMNETSRKERSHYHLCLGTLKAVLAASPDKAVCFDFNPELGPCDPQSYRGYYSDMAFQSVNGEVKAKDLLNTLEPIKEVTGYKGGTFAMTDDTPLWKSTYGQCEGLAIIGFTEDDNRIVLTTKQLERF